MKLIDILARYLTAISVFLGVLAPAQAQDRLPASVRAATVLFVSGGASAETAGSRQLKVGDAVFEGDLLRTDGNGHLYLRTVDQGFFSLRPGTVARVDVYRFDPTRPEETTIRLTLREGVMRAVSGKGAQSARDKYRLETPVAAIGLRGTDYTVHTTDETTRVSVQSGAVIVGSFGHGCVAGGVGPCRADASVELSAAQADRLVEVRSSLAPRLLEAPAQSIQRPERVSPPLPNEKGVASEALVTRIQVGREDPSASLREVQLLGVAERERQALEVLPPTPAPVASTLRWGRWADMAGQPTAPQISQILGSSAKLAALNSYFVLGRESAPRLPAGGVLSFSLAGSEAYVSNLGKVSPASLENGYLNIDLGAKSFVTGFDVSHGGSRYPLSIPGAVGKDGLLTGNITARENNVVLRGALGADGREAAYLFSGRLGTAGTVTGATYWAR